MRVGLLADFGSTFTKVIAVDMAEARIVGQSQQRSSAGGEILDSYEDAARAALGLVRGPTRVVLELAASSAGGGLRMAAVGLVPGLTAAAARIAALNAGARLAGVLAGRLTPADAQRLADLNPEIVLFAGGTDGGQEQLVLRNAAVLASGLSQAHVVIACNREIAARVAAIFAPAARSVTLASNVLPEIGVTDIDDARRAIGRLFMNEVIAGKELSQSARFGAMVKMATPDAVLRAATLLARARPDMTGDGVVVTDVGGATTDVYSVLTRRQAAGFGTQHEGLAAGPGLRTVEGDLGIRSNAPAVLEADGRWLESQLGAAGPEGWLDGACARRSTFPAVVFDGGRERAVDERLAVSCMFRALERHCGSRSVRPGVTGRPVLVQRGRSLAGCRTLIAGGGIVRAAAGADLARQALARLPEHVLAPRHCRIIVDRRYVLAAAGLLAHAQRDIAESLLRKELLEEPAHDGQ